MDLRDLVRALVSGDAIAARQWVADAARNRLDWSVLPAPALEAIELVVAAGVVELLASRSGQEPPAWTAEVGGAQQPVFLVRAAETMPRLRRLCAREGPEPLRRRQLMAPPDFLTLA